MMKLWPVALSVLIAFSLSCKKKSSGGGDSGDSSYTISVTVSGLSGSGLLVQNNGTDDTYILANGTSSFTTEINSGDAYDVTVKSQPLCPPQTCTVTSGSGTAGADVSISVSCADHSHLTFYSSSQDQTVKKTANFETLNDGDSASPTLISGASTTLTNTVQGQNIAVDRSRGYMYVVDEGIVKVFHGTTGNVAPDRTLTFSSTVMSAAIDYNRDRLYIVGTWAGTRALYILNDASTKSGAIASADATITPGFDATIVNYDVLADRLWIASLGGTAWYYDNANAMTSSSTPDGAMSISGFFGGPQVYAFQADSCHDRLYIVTRSMSNDGDNFFAFDASNLPAIMANHDVTVSSSIVAKMGFSNASGGLIDPFDNFYIWGTNVGNAVSAIGSISAKTGSISSVDKTFTGAVGTGLGADYITN